MSEQEYQSQIQSLIVKMLEKPKSLFQESSRYWEFIESGYYYFDRGKYIYIIHFSLKCFMILKKRNFFSNLS